MVLQGLSPDPSHEFDIDAGVVKDARARQRRQQAIAAVLVAMAALAGFLVLGGLGGGGSGAARADRGHGASPSAAAHTASEVGPAGSFSPPTIGASGLLSPGVGWAVNGLGFYMTWDGGRRWSGVHVPELSGDVLASFMAASSPSAHTLILAIGDAGSSYGTCADPAGSASRALGDVAVSTTAGRSWRTFAFPDCRVPSRISFLNARVGFAVAAAGKAVPPELLYGTTDGGRNWHQAGPLPKPGPIEFTSPRSGWLLGGDRIYRTSDGGRTWEHTNVCEPPAERGVSIVCGPPHFFGTRGVIQTIRAVSGIARSTAISATANDGRGWSTHDIAVNQRVQGTVAALVSAATAKDLFVYFRGGVLAKSTDGGRTWQQLPAPRFKGGTAINFISPSYGWIQDGGSLYATSDAGQHWQRMKQQGNQPPTP